MNALDHPTVDGLVELVTGLPLADHVADASLAELGIDSLAAMELLLAIEDAIGRPVELGALQSLRTVDDLRALLDDLAPGSRP